MPRPLHSSARHRYLSKRRPGGPRDEMSFLKKTKISCVYLDLNSGRSSPQPNRYAKYTTTVQATYLPLRMSSVFVLKRSSFCYNMTTALTPQTPLDLAAKCNILTKKTEHQFSQIFLNWPTRLPIDNTFTVFLKLFSFLFLKCLSYFLPFHVTPLLSLNLFENLG